jgi:molybdopterin converting factor small subunit
MAKVRYFAAARDASGCDEELREERTLGSLRAAIAAEHPALAGILPRCAVLVDGARVDDASALPDGALVDVLPPFAGG